jgi:hypothetical protein
MVFTKTVYQQTLFRAALAIMRDRVVPGQVHFRVRACCVGVIGFWLLLSGRSLAQVSSQQGQAKPTVVPEAPEKAEQVATVNVPLILQPLRLADFAGMRPRADVRDKLGHADEFIQNTPSDGQHATEATEVSLAHTKTTFYAVFLCFDSHPAMIRTHLARRENLLNDDNVTVLLDPFQDRRRGVLFQVNPTGVQADASWAEATGPDYSYDQVWDSEGRITQKGWMVLVAIPFRSLRFRTDSDRWGIVFERNFPRNSEVDYWPRIATSVSGVLTQEGTMRLPELRPRNIVLAPLFGKNSDTVGPQNGYPMMHNEKFTENLGGFVARGQPWAQMSFNLHVIRSGNVNYYPLTGAIPFLMNQETVQALISFNPLRQLTDDNTYLVDRDHSVKNGQLVYESSHYG